MKKNSYTLLFIVLLCVSVIFTFTACNNDPDSSSGNNSTVIFTDSCGREVEIPKNIERFAPAGAVAQMVLMPLLENNSENKSNTNDNVEKTGDKKTNNKEPKMVGIANKPNKTELKYISNDLKKMPVFGQFYGSSPNLNTEALLAADPQVIIDVGDMKKTQKEDMESIQDQTGIPVIFIDASLEKFPECYRTLGRLLDNQKKGEELASFIEDTLKMAEKNSKIINEKKTDKKSVFYGGGPEGLNGNAKGSCQADVIDIIGAENALTVKEINHAGGGNTVNMEELYNMDPDVIITTADGSYDKIKSSNSWADLSAVKNNRFYEIPNTPYNWMSQPPSMNRIIGIWWLGNLVYPDIYNFDIISKAQEFFRLFYNYDLSRKEAKTLLARSSLK